jgi:glycogen debranching enzyme
MGGWSPATEAAAFGGPGVTLVEGSSFCVCEPSGDIRDGTSQGVFFRDTRIISRWSVTLDGASVETLSVLTPEPWRATFIGRGVPRPGMRESTLLLRRDRYVGQGMREDLTLENLAGEPAAICVAVALDADFADVFEVKDNRARPRGRPRVTTLDGALQLVRSYPSVGGRRGVVVSSNGATATPEGLSFDVVVPPRGRWEGSLQVVAIIDDRTLGPRFPTTQALSDTGAAVRARAWRDQGPVVETSDPGLTRTLHRSQVDLGALRIVDPEQPDVDVVAAGAPWFMTLFGRDSLLTSYMALPLGRGLALGTLRTLARFQGEGEDIASEEEPGRILHEVRFGAEPSLALGGKSVYYGTADATPLFVVLLGELSRWGLDRAEIDRLLPNADRALAWVTDRGDRDGDLFIEYQRKTDRGLANQGWKDSWDGVTFADGTVARGPIALCEVQGYAYAAFQARAHLAAEIGDAATFQLWTDRAARLKEAFNERFWLPEKGYYALALDGAKRPVDSLASNMGHCLWSGVVDTDMAPAVAERLLSPEMFSGWGVRTLATTMGAYNPLSYHNGSVWPHDNALIVAGLMRYGLVAEAQTLATAILEAADEFGGRLPELFCGFDRQSFDSPVPYPTSCSPQAWASATPVQLLRTLLRFDPCVPHGTAWLSPVLPPAFPDITLHHLSLGSSRVELVVAGGALRRLTGLPTDLKLIDQPRPMDGDGWAPLTGSDPFGQTTTQLRL